MGPVWKRENFRFIFFFSSFKFRIRRRRRRPRRNSIIKSMDGYVLNHLSLFNDEIRQPPIHVHHRPSAYPFTTTTFSYRVQKHSAADAAEAMAFQYDHHDDCNESSLFIHEPRSRFLPPFVSFHLIYVLVLRTRWAYYCYYFLEWCDVLNVRPIQSVCLSFADINGSFQDRRAAQWISFFIYDFDAIIYFRSHSHSRT